jgi:triosephosphate isomerase
MSRMPYSGTQNVGALGETDVLINQKLIAAIKAGLVGIVCIGSRSEITLHIISHTLRARYEKHLRKCRDRSSIRW